jgi:hypothetical protein
VDVTLGVKVMNTGNLLTAFDPNFLHATTPLVNTESMGIMFTFQSGLRHGLKRPKKAIIGILSLNPGILMVLTAVKANMKTVPEFK